MDAMLDKREQLKEKQRKLYKIRKISKDIEIDILEDEIRHVKQDIKRYIKRCKINLSSQSLDELDKIVKEEKRNKKEICRSDIICSFIEFELNNRLEYLYEQAERLNIGVEDYIKILIENKYEQDNQGK